MSKIISKQYKGMDRSNSSNRGIKTNSGESIKGAYSNENDFGNFFKGFEKSNSGSINSSSQMSLMDAFGTNSNVFKQDIEKLNPDQHIHGVSHATTFMGNNLNVPKSSQTVTDNLAARDVLYMKKNNVERSSQPLFSPFEQSNRSLTNRTLQDIEKDYYDSSTKKNDENPFTQMTNQVKISANTRITPKTVDDLRAKDNQKTTGEGRAIGKQMGAKKALPGEFRFYRDDMTKTTDTEDLVKTGGVFQRQQQKGDLHLPSTHRDMMIATDIANTAKVLALDTTTIQSMNGTMHHLGNQEQELKIRPDIQDATRNEYRAPEPGILGRADKQMKPVNPVPNMRDTERNKSREANHYGNASDPNKSQRKTDSHSVIKGKQLESYRNLDTVQHTHVDNQGGRHLKQVYNTDTASVFSPIQKDLDLQIDSPKTYQYNSNHQKSQGYSVEMGRDGITDRQMGVNNSEPRTIDNTRLHGDDMRNSELIERNNNYNTYLTEVNDTGLNRQMSSQIQSNVTDNQEYYNNAIGMKDNNVQFKEIDLHNATKYQQIHTQYGGDSSIMNSSIEQITPNRHRQSETYLVKELDITQFQSQKKQDIHSRPHTSDNHEINPTNRGIGDGSRAISYTPGKAVNTSHQYRDMENQLQDTNKESYLVDSNRHQTAQSMMKRSSLENREQYDSMITGKEMVLEHERKYENVENAFSVPKPQIRSLEADGGDVNQRTMHQYTGVHNQAATSMVSSRHVQTDKKSIIVNELNNEQESDRSKYYPGEQGTKQGTTQEQMGHTVLKDEVTYGRDLIPFSKDIPISLRY